MCIRDSACSVLLEFPPTDYLPELARRAVEGLRPHFREGMRYQKAGLLLLQLIPRSHRVGHLWDDLEQLEKQDALMSVMEQVNRRWDAGPSTWLPHRIPASGVCASIDAPRGTPPVGPKSLLPRQDDQNCAMKIKPVSFS